MDKIELQNNNFNQLILLNLPPIQTRFIAYQLAENGVCKFTTEIEGKTLKIYSENKKYKVELEDIDIPINLLEPI
jgi:hypothetical protein